MVAATIHLNLANFRLYANNEELKKREDKFDVQPTNKEEERQFKDVKEILNLIRLSYWDDGAKRIGIQVFYINAETYTILNRVLLFLSGTDSAAKVKMKYRKLEIHPGEGVSHGEVHGEG